MLGCSVAPGTAAASAVASGIGGGTGSVGKSASVLWAILAIAVLDGGTGGTAFAVGFVPKLSQILTITTRTNAMILPMTTAGRIVVMRFLVGWLRR